MRITNRLGLAALTTMTLSAIACAIPTGEDAQQDSEALCKGVVCSSPITKHPLPPLPPIGWGSPTVIVTSDELDSKVWALLLDTHLSVDTTETAPEVFGPSTTYPNPDWNACEDQKTQCIEGPIGERAFCLAEVNAQCALIPETITTQAIEYSYLQFGPAAKLLGVPDVFFPLTTLHHSGSVFSFDFDINYIHATFDKNVTAGFQSGAAWIKLSDIESNTPTVNVEGSYPDVNLTNMVASVSLNGLAATPDGQSINYASVSSTFDFDWDVNVIPDWLVSDFVDVKGITQNRVTSRLNNGFNSEKAHTALSKALTELVAQDIAQVSPNGYASLGAISMSGLDLVVAYTPK